MVPSKLFLKDLKEQFRRVSYMCFLFPELLMITAYSTEKYCKRRKYHIFNGLFQSFKVLALRCASTLYT